MKKKGISQKNVNELFFDSSPNAEKMFIDKLIERYNFLEEKHREDLEILIMNVTRLILKFTPDTPKITKKVNKNHRSAHIKKTHRLFIRAIESLKEIKP